MKLKNYITFFFLINTIGLFSQVTIGDVTIPAPGALLHLKEFDPNDPRSNGLTTGTKGLMLPRVEIKELQGDLATSLGLPAATLDKDKHAGLLVYHVRANICSPVSSGVFTWDGDSWNRMGLDPNKTSFDPKTEILTDYEGNKYTTKVFGTKRWMTQNLRSIRKKDGSCIDPVNGVRINPAKENSTLPIADVKIVGEIPKKNITYFENGVSITIPTSDFIHKFGLLYTWNQANIACPRGWHLATLDEWDQLILFLGNTNVASKLKGQKQTKFKATDSSSSNAWGVSDALVPPSGFNVLPSGWMRIDGLTANTFGNSAYLWTSKQGAYKYIAFHHTSDISTFSGGDVNFRFSVRCVQDL